jgi:hypothetical protein
MPIRLRVLAWVCAGVVIPGAAWAGAPVPKLQAAGGIVRVTFEIAGGTAVAHFPDDIAAGEAFSGTFEAPSGYVLSQGKQTAKAGRSFAWQVPATGAEGMTLVLRDARGAEVGQIALRTPVPKVREAAFRVPDMIQAGRPFPVHGPFDGKAGNTRVRVGARPATVVAESVRRAIVRAPDGVLGATQADVRESGRRFTGEVRSLGLDVEPASPEAGRVERAITIRGLAGATRDVPIEMGAIPLYVRREEVPTSGVFTTTRTFRTVEGQAPISLVIPSSRKEEVEVALRTPSRTAKVKIARQHADLITAMPFDAMPIMRELLDDFQLGGEAAFAAFELDEPRALSMVLGAIPNVSTGVELIGLDYFIGRPAAVRAATADDARAAAHRVLARILSTTTAELAVYVLGLTGTKDDMPLLEKFAAVNGMGQRGLRDAAEAALGRLGSRPHLDRIHGELARVLTATSRYPEAAAVTRALRKAAFTGAFEMVPDVCTHLDDRKVWDVDISVDPGAVSLTSLAAIVDGSPVPPPAARRSRDDWRRYCQERVQ